MIQLYHLYILYNISCLVKNVWTKVQRASFFCLLLLYYMLKIYPLLWKAFFETWPFYNLFNIFFQSCNNFGYCVTEQYYRAFLSWKYFIIHIFYSLYRMPDGSQDKVVVQNMNFNKDKTVQSIDGARNKLIANNV